MAPKDRRMYHSLLLKQSVSEKALDDKLKIPTAMNETAKEMSSQLAEPLQNCLHSQRHLKFALDITFIRLKQTSSSQVSTECDVDVNQRFFCPSDQLVTIPVPFIRREVNIPN